MKMMIITFIFSTLLSSHLTLGQTTGPLPKPTDSIFKNKREGKSKSLNLWNNFWLKKKNINITKDFFKDFSGSSQLCAENYINQLVFIENIEKKNLKYALLSLRKNNLIDDLVLDETIKYKKLPTKIELELNLDNLKSIKTKTNLKQALGQFSTYFKKRKCLNESISQLFSSITANEKSPKKKKRAFKKTLRNLAKHKVISKENKDDLIRLVKKDIHQGQFSLKSYNQTRMFLMKNIKVENYNNSVQQGISDFVSSKDKINKVYPRNRLYKNFNQFQIIMMAQIMERFIYRLENTATMGIHLFNNDEETIDIFYIDSPMEIYRFLVKYLRYEMAKLKENHLFQGTTVLYTDIIAASFELYQIPPSSIDELVKMEEIWNPQVSNKEKIISWGKLFTQAGIIFIPPPYNYLASLSIMVIESFTKGSKQEASYEHSIFGDVR